MTNMSVDANAAKAIFMNALDKSDAAERAAYLAEACGNDEMLRRRVDLLLRAHDEPGRFLESPVPLVGDTPDEADCEGPGTVIGQYKLIEQIGEGGFSLVYMAEQTHPVRRKVAFKILKPGMGTRQVVARFEAERQAVALMDHPNIAKVLDAGATSTGRPYFVMELVKGVPITEFCDQNHLTLRQRLELFASACSAVQHAHQKGIIHRDLKPSNVLVALYDDKPVPKVIDFGIAKAIGQQLTEHTLHTGFWAVVGTLEYMSPEQASFNQLDIDTRSDIYSLGILFYELLTSTTPLHHKRAKEAGMLEALRIIREEETPTLSARLSATAELPSIATQRGLEPAKLTRQVQGELNWIAMKALEKDRDRRYATATDLAADVNRYLSDEPVQACPPSTGYRFRKFARRNKGTVLAVATIFLLLVAGISGTSWGLIRAEHARKAEAEQRGRADEAAQKAKREAAIAVAINDFLNKDILQLSNPLGQASSGVSPDANLTLRTVLRRAAKRIDGKFPNEPEVEMRLRYTIGASLVSLGDNAAALPQLEKVVAASQELLGRDDLFTLNAEYRLAGIHRQLGHVDLALRMSQENLERRKAVLGDAHPQTFRGMNGLAVAYQAKGQIDKALLVAQQNLELRKRYLGPMHSETLVSMNNVAWLYQENKQLEKALPLFEETLAKMRAKLQPLHPERLNTTANLARAYYLAEQIDKAVALDEAVLPQFKTAYGIDDARTQFILNSLIGYYADFGFCDKAELLLQSIQRGGANRPADVNQTQEQREKRFDELLRRIKPAATKYQQELAAKKADHLDTLAARQAFAVALRVQGRRSAAAYHLKAVLDVRLKLQPADSPDIQTCRIELGATRLQQKKYGEAESLLLEAYAVLKGHESKQPKAQKSLTKAMDQLAKLYERWDKKDKAEQWRKKLEEQTKQ
jgi:serine/threonine protein kinase